MQHILVIDDDPAVTSLLKRGLSYEGFAGRHHLYSSISSLSLACTSFSVSMLFCMKLTMVVYR